MLISRLGRNARSLVSGLFDLEFKTIITTQMLPVIYGLSITLSGIATLYFIAWGFGQSWWLGLTWLLVAGPALFLALVTTVRVILEFVLTVFRIAFYVEAMAGQVEGIAGQTEGIAEDLPRIKFWKSFTGDARRTRSSSREEQ